MSNNAHGTRACYQAGCRLDQCKSAEAEYRRERRRLRRESVGEFAEAQVTNLSLVTGDGEGTPERVAGRVESAVQVEIEALTPSRGGLVAIALELARVMDSPKATTSKAAVAGRLEDILDTLRKNQDGKKSKLASVRAMTSGNAKSG